MKDFDYKKNEYFSMRVSSDPKVIGVNNGIYQMELIEKYFKPKEKLNQFLDNFSSEDFDKLQNIKDPIPMKKLKKAKMTDFMGFCPNLTNVSFVLSQRALKVFEQFAMKSYYTLPISFPDESEIKESYFLFSYPPESLEDVIFSESVIYTGSHILGKKYHKIDSYKEFMEFKSANSLYSFAKIVMSDDYLAWDIIKPRIGGLFVSKRLREKIEMSGLTGTSFDNLSAATLDFSNSKEAK